MCLSSLCGAVWPAKPARLMEKSPGYWAVPRCGDADIDTCASFESSHLRADKDRVRRVAEADPTHGRGRIVLWRWGMLHSAEHGQHKEESWAVSAWKNSSAPKNIHEVCKEAKSLAFPAQGMWHCIPWGSLSQASTPGSAAPGLLQLLLQHQPWPTAPGWQRH